MLINSKKLVGMHVKTESGFSLGKVYEFDIDIDTLEIVKIYVSGSLIEKNILQKELIIDRSQIIEVTKDALIVEDSVNKNLNKEFAQA